MLLAVLAIHKEGIIHSDLKPANFLFVNELLKLIDFGIATSMQQDVTSVHKEGQVRHFLYYGILLVFYFMVFLWYFSGILLCIPRHPEMHIAIDS